MPQAPLGPNERINMYQVLARKWRPQRFEELVGQRHVCRTLANAIETDRLAHAYIFAGVRGTGKTTAARILAKCLNCETGPATSPCGTCAPCGEIAESRAIDVLEIDAASRTKVEQTRELLEVVSYAPARDRYKILIIDEAHMLSKASFNALLKTLEEPPPNVLFVLATTELQKILPTIHSRCQVFEFRRVAPREVAAHLRKVCDDEGMTISDTALERIARAGEGSIRDSLSVLERVLAFCGERVEDADVLRVLGAVRSDVLTQLVRHLAARNAAGMLGVLDSLVDEGHDLLHFWNELIAALRDLLLLRSVPDRPELLTRSPEEAAALGEAAESLSREDLTRSFQILAELELALKSSAQPRFMFEAALIRLASLGAVRPIEEVLRSLGDPVRATQKKNLAAQPAEAPPSEPPSEPTRLISRFVEQVQEAEPMLGAILEQAASVREQDGCWQIRFDPGNEPLARQLESKGLERLKSHATQVAGRDVALRIGTDEAAAAPSPQPESAASAERPGSNLLEQAKREPGVRKLLREFGAQVVDIRPLGARVSGEEPS